jgi:Holliday junction resolvase
MRRKARIDENQPDIVKHLRTLGMSVCLLHTVGQGVPDICVGYRGINVLLEIKDSKQPKCKQKLTTDEADWHLDWRGQVATVKDKEEAEAEVMRCWSRSVAR